MLTRFTAELAARAGRLDLCGHAGLRGVLRPARPGPGHRHHGRVSCASSFMALGDGTHELPVRADVRRAIGKDVGDTVTVVIRTADR
jgi:hypothetical protein